MPAIPKKKIIALDTETTGVDLHKGAYPFLVTFYDPLRVVDGEPAPQFWYEWPVDPHERKVLVNEADLDEIQAVIDAADLLILQNSKFDFAALTLLYKSYGRVLRWPWEKVRDTLIAGHMLASNRPKDLTALAMSYLGLDILPFEKEMEAACKEARKIADKMGWRIAKHGDEDMPSIKKSGNKATAESDDRPWKFDCWIPRAVATELLYPEGHPWYTVTSKYANGDSSSTYAVWIKAQEPQLRSRGLWEIFLERMKLPKVISKHMEGRGATVRISYHANLRTEFQQISVDNEKEMIDIAKGFGHELQLPKGAVNNNLRELVWEKMKLPPVYNSKSKTANPTLDSKNAIPFYLVTLPTGSPELKFIQLLEDKRGMDTALSYLASYDRFWIEEANDVARLYANLNPTATDTLRFNMVKPNLQQVSKKNKRNVRKCFGPAPGREWWALDFENIELRIPAYEAKEPELIALFERPDEPPYYGSEHLLNFSTVYPDIWEPELAEQMKNKEHIKDKYGDTWYQSCKNGDFAIQYQAGDRTADAAFRRAGSRKRLKERFARKEKLNQYWISFAHRHGYVETLPDKTVNPHKGYPLLCTRTETGSILPTIPLSYHVQSTAMQCTCKGMTRGDEYLEELCRKRKQLYYMCLQVHDEIVLDFPKGGRQNLPYVREFARLMAMSGDDIGVPLKVSITFHPDNWGTKEKAPWLNLAT